jgi:tetratricopeptide (TPR) repeat protein
MRRSHSTRTCMFTALGLVTVLAFFGPARAQAPALPASPALPQQSAPLQPSSLAAELFAEGTALYKQWHFDKAEEKFREALAHWEHPIIHLYLSRALEKQGRLVEAHASLQQALRPGAEALPPEDVQVAEELQKSLESRLAQIDVSCDVPGAEVSLDGEDWFTAPGRQRRMTSAGQHVLIARKPGYFPVAEPVSLIPGKQTRVMLRMTADVVHVERRWQPWQPWAMAGTGIVMSLTGRWFRQQAASDYASFEKALDSCRQTISCQMVPTQRLDSGEWKEIVGTSSLVVGGTVVAAGLAGVLFNLPSTWRSEPASGVEKLDIAPMIAGDAAGISAQIRF